MWRTLKRDKTCKKVFKNIYDATTAVTATRPPKSKLSLAVGYSFPSIKADHDLIWTVFGFTASKNSTAREVCSRIKRIKYSPKVLTANVLHQN